MGLRGSAALCRGEGHRWPLFPVPKPEERGFLRSTQNAYCIVLVVGCALWHTAQEVQMAAETDHWIVLAAQWRSMSAGHSRSVPQSRSGHRVNECFLWARWGSCRRKGWSRTILNSTQRNTDSLGIALKCPPGVGCKLLIIVGPGWSVHKGSLYQSLYFGNACKCPYHTVKKFFSRPLWKGHGIPAEEHTSHPANWGLREHSGWRSRIHRPCQQKFRMLGNSVGYVQVPPLGKVLFKHFSSLDTEKPSLVVRVK